MLTISELLILQKLAEFAESNNINKSKLARDTCLSRQKVQSSLKKFRRLEINVKS